MNGMQVGYLIKSSAGGLSFKYDQQWLQYPGARPISLSMPLLPQTYRGDVVYNFFDNLLPDNAQLRACIQAMFQAQTSQPFDLLAQIGKDCVGAIQLNEAVISFDKKIEAEKLSVSELADMLKHFKTAPLGMQNAQDDFRISLAGAQEKAAFLKYKRSWCKPMGTTPTSHIFKLPIGMIEYQHMDLRDSCENEWLCTRIANAFGLPVASAEIAKFEDTKALIVARFDRRWSADKTWLMRLPQEDLCQALGCSPNLKYESDGGPGILDIMSLLRGSKKSEEDRILFLRAQILFYLLAAIDGHAKNFSLFIEPDGHYCLTPLYDIMSAFPLITKKQLQKQKIKMAMAFIGKNKQYVWQKIQRRHIFSTALAAGFSKDKIENILSDMLDRVEAVIATVSAELPADFPAYIADSIFSGMREATAKLLL